jgi:Holliday junction resolvasome RuvABC endonuclease subunit
MRLIGIDQSSSSTGLSVFDNGELVYYELIKIKKTTSKKITEVITNEEEHLYEVIMPELIYKNILGRICIMSDRIEHLIDKYKPDKVYIEDIFASKNKKTEFDLGRLQGFILHSCHKRSISYKIVPENVWINTWGKYGRTVKRPERKRDIMHKVNEWYNLSLTVDDVSDAIAIGKYATLNNIKGE